MVFCDRLLIATGTRARPWHNPDEASLDGVLTLRGRDDAEKLATSDEEKIEVYFMRGALLERQKKFDAAERPDEERCALGLLLVELRLAHGLQP